MQLARYSPTLLVLRMQEARAKSAQLLFCTFQISRSFLHTLDRLRDSDATTSSSVMVLLNSDASNRKVLAFANDPVSFLRDDTEVAREETIESRVGCGNRGVGFNCRLSCGR
jgi:hypothetical protein